MSFGGALDAEGVQLRIALELSRQEAAEREILDAAEAVEDVRRSEAADRWRSARARGAAALRPRGAAAPLEVSDTDTSCRSVPDSAAPDPVGENAAGTVTVAEAAPPLVNAAGAVTVAEAAPPLVPTLRRDLAELPARYRAYAVWRAPSGLHGVAVCADPGGWPRFSERVLLGPLAGSGARIRRAPTAEAAVALYRREAARHGVPLAPTYWNV